MQYNFNITDNAKKRIGVLLASEPVDSVFRISVKGGGCSGFSYEFNVDNQKLENDIYFACGDYKLVIDDVSIAFLKDSQLDYVQELIGAQFEIKNPNAKSSCGCGVSFSV